MSPMKKLAAITYVAVTWTIALGLCRAASLADEAMLGDLTER